MLHRWSWFTILLKHQVCRWRHVQLQMGKQVLGWYVNVGHYPYGHWVPKTSREEVMVSYSFRAVATHFLTFPHICSDLPNAIRFSLQSHKALDLVLPERWFAGPLQCGIGLVPLSARAAFHDSC
jgi:hypothetical protein